MSVTPLKYLANAAGTDETSLALKQYSGSFVKAPRSGIFLYDKGDYIFKKSPASGKSWQFLMGGDVPDPDNYTPGTDLLGQVWGLEENTIETDQYMVCHKWIGKDQMQHSHVDVLSFLGTAHKSRIERTIDRRVFIKAAQGARQTTAVTKNGVNIHNGGNRVTRTGGSVVAAYPDSATGASNFRADLRSLGLAMDIDNIAPETRNRKIFFTPEMRYKLAFDNTAQVFSRDYNNRNDVQNLRIEEVERFEIAGHPNFTSNNGPIPNENINTGPSTYYGNFTAQAADGIPVAIAIARGMEGEYGVGMVEFEGLHHTVKYFEERLSWLVMTYIRTGIRVMHPWCLGSVEVIT
jgi:hypothetical protein